MARRTFWFYFSNSQERHATYHAGTLSPAVIRSICPVVLAGAFFLSGCSSYVLKGGDAQAQTSFTLSLSPSATQVSAGQSVQFAANVIGTTAAPLTWAVNGVQGGSTTTGTISATGLYLAPSAMPLGGSVIVSVAGAAGSGASASALVNVTNTLTISPGSETIPVGSTLQFTATLNGVTGSQANWSVANIPGGNVMVGTISSSGLYTAPAVVPSSSVSVTAVDPADSSSSASAVVLVFDPALEAAHGQWLSGATGAAASDGCTGSSVQQEETESLADVIARFGEDGTEGSCLILWPISASVGPVRYSQAWGGKVDGKDILYISDVSRMRIWNAAPVSGN